MMLENVPSKSNRRTVFRLSRVFVDDDQFLSELNLDAESRTELLELLPGTTPENPLKELLDGPFRSSRSFRNKTRFSDGSYPVFYSALAPATANAEIAYWFRKIYVGNPRRNRSAYYQGFHCTFEGLEKDLRPETSEWPDLVHDSDYSFCNQLGAEAREEGVDGLVVPSARHEGTNMPVFRRRAVSNPKLDGIVALTYDPERDVVSFDCIAQDPQG